MDSMRKKLPLYVLRQKTQHGRWVLYFRRGKGARLRMPDDVDSPEFVDAYHAALTGQELPTSAKGQPPPQSIRWLIDRYRESAAWRQLALGSRKQREQVFVAAIERSDNAPFARFTRAKLHEAMDRRADRPAAANTFLKAFRGLFAWAVLNGHVEHDPTLGIKRMSYRSDGFPAWTVDDVAAYRARHPIGTKARLAMELLLLTGLRRSDLVTAGRQHLRGDVFSLRTQKTGAQVTVRFPAGLVDVINRSPTGDMHFLVTEYGKPFTAAGFGNWCSDRCREAGITKSAHGLRKLSATLAANGGAGAHELMAQYGWSKIEQAEIYTRGADRARLGVRASEIVADQIENSIPDEDGGKEEQIAPHLKPR